MSYKWSEMLDHRFKEQTEAERRRILEVVIRDSKPAEIAEAINQEKITYERTQVKDMVLG